VRGGGGNFCVPGSAGAISLSPLGPNFDRVAGVFGELELAAVVDHLGADSSVDENLRWETDAQGGSRGAVARADTRDSHARGQRDNVVEIVVAVQILAVILQAAVVPRLGVGVDLVF